ncbi:heterokaryon incompatibility protein (HET) domain-containing protein [Pochonia chlamydosporia 170]|uniref:Heterokaryon incompatibility protein (HET) domain-containing protein n=1 Tax=Pochonia chlamydosporia 170 TaxID=1380566 RepID=A0A219AP83_METCM|nr:heterokaryon incompatibility protein (HET) domain-containing protein [Pochonia chlamydosporia 170]OWT42636.1 heterokaryon incompatibility protein (HET) domain-containing protein [Pochonia chlamydosporia 170]
MQLEMVEAQRATSSTANWHRRASQFPSFSHVVDEICVMNIRSWLAHCQVDTAHSKCRPASFHWPTFPGVQFRVIDVFRRCITVCPDGCQYLALSYVWGGVDQPKLILEVLDRLMQEGGLDVIWTRIPQTVRDAIAFCQQIGERYLWVDALCIIQDYPRDMRLSILRMRQVYAAAKCTLGAISASSAEASILNNFTTHKWTCLTVESLHKLIEKSPWSQRAWCYQEKVLSRRMIFFTTDGLYMQCQAITYNGMGTSLVSETDRATDTRQV